MKTFSRILCACGISAICALPLSASASSITPAASSDSSAKGGVPVSEAEMPAPEAEISGHQIPITIYSQEDPSWGSYLYGGRDPMALYGCGPSALAIAVASLTGQDVTPVTAADWSAANGYFSPGRGSVHGLIPDGARSFGLNVERLSSPDPDSFRLILSVDKLLVLLMGPGDFTDNGHFIVAYGYDGQGNILIADPASAQRSSTPWPAETIINQLSKNARDGGPVWVLSKP